MSNFKNNPRDNYKDNSNQPTQPPKSAARLMEIPEEFAGQRIDNFLIRELKIPKSRIYQMMRTGEVRVNKGRIKPTYRMQPGDILRIPPVEQSMTPAPAAIQARHEKLLENIIYEDKNLLILNKPAGLAVHGGDGVGAGVIEALRILKPEEKFMELAHRLDKETSGCLIIAKNRPALLHLHGLFKDGKIKKIYHAWVAGRWPKSLNKVECKLQRSDQEGVGRKVTVVDDQSEEGKESLSTFCVLKHLEDSTQLEVRLHTGRTHQIRVHCQISGFPIIGDDKYGKHGLNQKFAQKGMKRLHLHCYYMGFEMPGGEKVEFFAKPSLWEMV